MLQLTKNGGALIALFENDRGLYLKAHGMTVSEINDKGKELESPAATKSIAASGASARLQGKGGPR